jgi:hypothetical protein
MTNEGNSLINEASFVANYIKILLLIGKIPFS